MSLYLLQKRGKKGKCNVYFSRYELSMFDNELLCVDDVHTR